MSEVVYMVWCSACQSTTEIEVVTDEWLDGKPISGGYACARCGKRLEGIWMDGGTLDLGIVRDSVAGQDNDFQVFPQEPWKS